MDKLEKLGYKKNKVGNYFVDYGKKDTLITFYRKSKQVSILNSNYGRGFTLEELKAITETAEEL